MLKLQDIWFNEWVYGILLVYIIKKKCSFKRKDWWHVVVVVAFFFGGGSFALKYKMKMFQNLCFEDRVMLFHDRGVSFEAVCYAVIFLVWCILVHLSCTLLACYLAEKLLMLTCDDAVSPASATCDSSTWRSCWRPTCPCCPQSSSPWSKNSAGRPMSTSEKGTVRHLALHTADAIITVLAIRLVLLPV